MAYSLLGVVNALLPKDIQSHRIARDVSYGPSTRHKLDIYAPRWKKGPLPVVFFVYGGSWSDGDRHNYAFAGRAMAALGYLCVVADYRLVPEVEYPGFIEDGVAAFAWVTEHIADYGGDPGRMALMGHSAGAYNAMAMALDQRFLQKAGLLDRVRCVVGLSGPYDFYPFDGPISLRAFGAVRDPAATQPINHVRSALPPAFLGSGDRDGLVSPRNSIKLAQKLRAAGVVVQEAHYANLAHAGPLIALSVPGRLVAPVYADVAAFLRQHLG